jgi:hypothetical protein
MELISCWKTHAAIRPKLRGSIKHILAAAALAAAFVAPGASWALAGQDSAAATDPESVAHANWRDLMAHNPASGEGCFHASYPDQSWQSVDCKVSQALDHTEPVRPTAGAAPAVTGNTNDYVAQAQGLITEAIGTFQTTDVKSETGVGVAEYKDKGILGANEYSLQLNTNANESTAACAHHSGCTVWQQFLYSTDYYEPGVAAVYIEYWLLGWGSSDCPTSSWHKYNDDCWINSALTPVGNISITDLDTLGFYGKAEAGGDDKVFFSYGSEAVSMSFKDSVLDIASVWKQAEFNILGDTDGSRADFNKGASINVFLELVDGSNSAPKCVADAGTTGESNNLNLGKCEASVELFPQIVFSESN